MIDLRTLGGVDLSGSSVDDLQAVLQQPKQVAVLVYLAVAGSEGFVRRDKLLGLFWPELDTDHARGSLRTTLHRLRRSIGDGAIVTRGAEELRLSAEAVRCDAACLVAAAKAGDHRQVLDQFRGEFLDGFFAGGCSPDLEQWIDVQRRSLRDLAVGAAWALCDEAEGRHALVEASRYARRAVAIARADEPAIRRLLLLLIAQGDHAGATEVYDDFSRRLQLELQTEPSAETRKVIDVLRPTTPKSPATQARGGRPRPAAVAPIGPTAPTGMPAASVVAQQSAEEHAQDAPPARRWWAWMGAALLVAIAGAGYVRVRDLRSEPRPATRQSSWELLTIAGNPPIPRSHPVAVLDSTGRSILIVGGRNGLTLVGDVWRLSGIGSSKPVWSRVAMLPDSSPRARWLAAAAYNPRTDRLMMFGGALGYTSPCTDELWIMSNVSGIGGPPHWQRVPHPGGAPWPTGRGDHRVAYDDAHNRLIVYGGHDCIAPVYTDVWILKNADGTTGAPQWERLSPDSSAGAPLAPRGQAMGYNPATNRLVVFGGFHNPERRVLDETWILTHANGLEGKPEWQRLKVSGALPPGRVNSFFGYDAATNRLVVASGNGIGRELTDAWVLVGADGTPPESRWVRLDAEPAPPARSAAVGILNAAAEILLIVGGQREAGPVSDVWLLRNALGR